jgi:hypothetical protein
VAAVTQNLTSVCSCGATALALVGAPIVVATCHCESCEAAARQFEEEGAVPLIGTAGGVDYVLFRKDRVTLLRGKDNLSDRRLTTSSPTRRVVATCCQSPMFLDFAPGHWLSLYRSNLADRVPAPSIRSYSPRFFIKLMGAWAAMRFRCPKLSF